MRFLGVRADVPEILSASDIFALTSRSEAASITLLEAMACGLPVVATAVGGNPEIVRDGVDGRLVPRGDHLRTGQVLLEILNDPSAAAALGRSALATVRERYQLGRTIEHYHHCYTRVARPSGSEPQRVRQALQPLSR